MSESQHPALEGMVFQCIVRAGDVFPNNDENAWGDWCKLVKINARLMSNSTPEVPVEATQYLLFGQKLGVACFRPITKEEAEKYMHDAFWHQAETVARPVAKELSNQ